MGVIKTLKAAVAKAGAWVAEAASALAAPQLVPVPVRAKGGGGARSGAQNARRPRQRVAF